MVAALVIPDVTLVVFTLGAALGAVLHHVWVFDRHHVTPPHREPAGPYFRPRAVGSRPGAPRVVPGRAIPARHVQVTRRPFDWSRDQ